MNGKNAAVRRIGGLIIAFVGALILSLGFNAGAIALAGTAQGAVPAAVAAPLKPDWVEALLDARATALRSQLAARDLLATQHGLSAATLTADLVRIAAPLKPDWVEALLDARATALRSLLEARDLQATRSLR